MMNMTASKPTGWGEARVAEKRARTNRRRAALAVVTIAVVLGFPFIDGVRGGTRHPAPEWVLDAMLIPLLLLAVLVSWRNWRDADEVQRLLAVQTWAVIGFSGFLLQTIVTIAAKYITLSNPGYVAWLMSAAFGLGFYFVRRVRS